VKKHWNKYSNNFLVGSTIRYICLEWSNSLWHYIYLSLHSLNASNSYDSIHMIWTMTHKFKTYYYTHSKQKFLLNITILIIIGSWLSKYWSSYVYNLWFSHLWQSPGITEGLQEALASSTKPLLHSLLVQLSGIKHLRLCSMQQEFNMRYLHLYATL
jgi:hypothetical protein